MFKTNFVSGHKQFVLSVFYSIVLFSTFINELMILFINLLIHMEKSNMLNLVRTLELLIAYLASINYVLIIL